MSFDKNLRFAAADKIERRAEWIRAFNAEAVARPDAWIISTPNAALCMIEVLATSGWPAELVKRGYPLEEIEDGQRILPYDVATPMEMAPDGPLDPGNREQHVAGHDGQLQRRHHHSEDTQVQLPGAVIPSL